MSSIENGGVRLTLRACAEGSAALSALWRDFEAGRLPHALLLSGESGIGKKTFARTLGQALLCTAEGEEKPCGKCRECRRFLNGTHPDALFPVPLPKEKSIKIDSLREMIEALSRHSLEGGRRVIVIENSERMTPQAQNCLLKTLEEAAEGTYFLLTADVEASILPTIRSRCRVTRVQPWAPERIEKELLRRGIAPERARELARCCEGSLGKALRMQEDEGYWAARKAVRGSFMRVKSTADIPEAAARLKDQKDQADRLLDILDREIRALLQNKAGHGPGIAADIPSEWESARTDSLLRISEAILLARKQRAANVGWPAVSEELMQKIAEEAKQWQV